MIAKGKHLHLDCPSGIAGDMMLGALFDLGVPEAVVREALALLPVKGWVLQVSKTSRGGLVGTDVKVQVDVHDDDHDTRHTTHDHDHDHDHAHDHAHDHDHAHAHDHEHEHTHPGDVRHDGWHAKQHAHRHYRDIRAMLELLPADVRSIARAIFDRVALAEAKLHGSTVDEVAFHEVGAIDSIIDIVGTAAAVAHLAPAAVTCTPIPLGHGTVQCAHGLLPIPAPATLEILSAAHALTTDGGAAFELTTPTGAAIVAELSTAYAPMPAGHVLATGWGAGDAELADRPNLVRAVLLEPDPTAPRISVAPAGDTVVQIEANLDDLSPELCEHVMERLFAAGALDAWWTPITMKKSRPALALGVLAPPDRLDALAEVLFRETSTIGLRHQLMARRVLARRIERVDTPYGPVAIKLALLDGQVVNAAPEYEDCRRIARERGIPLKQVYAAANAAAVLLTR